MILVLLIAAAVTNPPQISFSQDSSQAARRSLANKFADTVSVKDAPWLAVGDGSANDMNAFSLALGVHKGRISAPASTYYLGTTGLVITDSDRWIDGEGYGSPGAGPTSFVYTGSGCAITVESAQRVHLSNFDIQVNSASSTAACLCFKATTLNPEFPIVENVSCTNTGTQRLAGQVGLWLDDTGAGIYWGLFKKMIFKGWDTSILLQGGSSQGVNDNDFADLMSYGHNLAWRAIGAGVGLGNVEDNTVRGLKCSRSDGTFTGTSTCMLWGDDGSVAFGNEIKGVVNDSGGIGPSVCGSFGANTGANSFEGSCESGGGFVNNQAATTSPTIIAIFPNDVKNRLGLGSTNNRWEIGNLVTTRGAQVVGSTFIGLTGGGSGGAGGNVVFGGGAGNAGQPGGTAQVLGGNGGAGNAKAGDVLFSPGNQTGTGAGGAAVIGPPSGGGSGSGTRIRSSRVIIDSKPFGEIDCSGSNLGPTISQFLDASTFTCSTTQTITTNTAATIVANLPGSAIFTNGAVAIGDRFILATVVATGLANFTLVGGTGVTIKGNAVANNSTLVVTCELKNVTSGTEAINCYPAGGGVSVASANTWTGLQTFSGRAAIAGSSTKENLLLTALSADPSSPDIGGVWSFDDGVNATALKFRSSGGGATATYIMAPIVANTVSSVAAGSSITLPSNNMTCICNATTGTTFIPCSVSGTTLSIAAHTGTVPVAYHCLMTQ